MIGCLIISAADPLNLAGIVTAGERVRAAAGTRVAYQNGVPIALPDSDRVGRVRFITQPTLLRGVRV